MRWLLVAMLLFASCKRSNSSAPPLPAQVPVPQPPASTAEQDALWRLAPDGADIGLVVSSRGLVSLESGFAAVKQLFHTSPELKSAALEVDVKLRKYVGTSVVTLANLGMSPGKGAAWFRLTDGGEVGVLPVIDRTKFVAAMKGTHAADGDVVDDYVCKAIQAMYACAKPADLLTRLGKDGMRDDIKLAGARGDIEIVGDVEGVLSTPVTIAAVAQLAHGSVVVRGGIDGLPPLISAIKPVGKPMVDASKAIGFSVLNLTPLLAALPLPSEPIVPGVAFDELAKNIDAPITVSIAPDATDGNARIPVKNAALAQELIEQCGAIGPLMMFGANANNGVCHLSIPLSASSIDAWVESNAIHIGKNGAAPTSATLPPTPIATELASGEWGLAVYGRGTLLAERHIPPLLSGLSRNRAKLGLRAPMMVNEIGVGLRADGNILRFVASLRTAWSNPDDVVAKIVEITPSQVDEGKSGALAKQIATTWPSSPFATDLRGGLVGVMSPAAAISLVAGFLTQASVDEEDEAPADE